MPMCCLAIAPSTRVGLTAPRRGSHLREWLPKLRGAWTPTHSSRPRQEPGKGRPMHGLATAALVSSSSSSSLADKEDEDEHSSVAPDSVLARFNALVLDSAYRPIRIVNWRRAVCLEYLRKCDVLEYYDARVRSVSTEFYLPAVLRARTYLHRPNRMVRMTLNRRSIMLRDKHTCQYCGSRENLTLDHIVPASKGGGFTWDNIVTCCSRCNAKKGARTLKELKWSLQGGLPKEPRAHELNILLSPGPRDTTARKIPAEWEAYMFHLMQRSGSEASTP
ncbi:hypothetical protein ACKKBG_A17940 [Auxenochlorella protothecoides x Auxenochlorella symbiontica]